MKRRSNFLPKIQLLAFGDSVVRTNLRAATAADACVGVDLIDITLRNSVHRTNRHASAACYTVVTNYVCHSLLIFKLSCYLVN